MSQSVECFHFTFKRNHWNQHSFTVFLRNLSSNHNGSSVIVSGWLSCVCIWKAKKSSQHAEDFWRHHQNQSTGYMSHSIEMLEKFTTHHKICCVLFRSSKRMKNLRKEHRKVHFLAFCRFCLPIFSSHSEFDNLFDAFLVCYSCFQILTWQGAIKQ